MLQRASNLEGFFAVTQVFLELSSQGNVLRSSGILRSADW
jgi:hypothetical protein